MADIAVSFMQSRMSGSSSLARRRSSSLSDLDDIDTEQETKASIHNSSAAITDDNDSEAETERLHDSPHLLQRHKKVILGPDNHGQVFDRSPSKLQNQISVENQHNALSGDDESSLSEVESPSRESDVESPRAASPQLPPVVKDEVSPNSRHVIEYVKDSLAAEQNLLPPSLADTKKRKRSIMADSSLVELVEEPSRKRTGSVKTSADDFAIEDDPLDEEADKANDVIDVLTDEDAAEAAAALREDITMADAEDEGAASQPQSPRRASRRKRRPGDSEVNGNHAEDTENGIPNGDAEGEEGDDDPEVVAKSEEERE